MAQAARRSVGPGVAQAGAREEGGGSASGGAGARARGGDAAAAAGGDCGAEESRESQAGAGVSQRGAAEAVAIAEGRSTTLATHANAAASAIHVARSSQKRPAIFEARWIGWGSGARSPAPTGTTAGRQKR